MKKLPYYYIISFALYFFTIFCLQFFHELEDWEYKFWGIVFLLAPFIQVWHNEFYRVYDSTKDRRPSIWRKLDDRFIEWSTKTKEQETDYK